MSRTMPLIATSVALLASLLPASAVTIDTVSVGNAGNPSDPTTGYGSVPYEYRIGTNEVTNAQYVDFLNAKAASDPLGLYNPLMTSDIHSGITRSGVSGSFTYASKVNFADKPVNFVSWFDAIRFANWLNNGQGSADTESGAYTIVGDTAVPDNGDTIARNIGAVWFLPSEREWYKAAYYQPAASGGDADDYWLYPTKSNTVPTIATANSVGDISNPGVNVANYGTGAKWNGSNLGNITTVGSAGSLSRSYYGTSDQGGNVYEWNESLIVDARGRRGGGWGNAESGLQSSTRAASRPTGEGSGIGFRVANIPTGYVPEPSTFALGIMGVIGVLASSWRRWRR